MQQQEELTRARLTQTNENTQRNQEHQYNIPDGAKPKTKNDPSPKRLPNVPNMSFPEPASGSADNPEETHEPREAPGRPKETQTDKYEQPIKTDAKTKPKAKAKAPRENPPHDTEIDENRSRDHWGQKGRGYMVDQLSKRGRKLPKTKNGTNKRLAVTDLRKIIIEMMGLD